MKEAASDFNCHDISTTFNINAAVISANWLSWFRWANAFREWARACNVETLACQSAREAPRSTGLAPTLPQDSPEGPGWHGAAQHQPRGTQTFQTWRSGELPPACPRPRKVVACLGWCHSPHVAGKGSERAGTAARRAADAHGNRPNSGTERSVCFEPAERTHAGAIAGAIYGRWRERPHLRGKQSERVRPLSERASDLERVSTYEAHGASAARLVHGNCEAHAYLVRFDADGAIGQHEAGYGKLFIVLDGRRWVSGRDGVCAKIAAGDVVLFDRCEHHAKGSDTGMTAVVEQVRDLFATRAALASSP